LTEAGRAEGRDADIDESFNSRPARGKARLHGHKDEIERLGNGKTTLKAPASS